MSESNESRPRILIIDDMAINQMLLSSQLGALNVKTDVCSSGERGLELYRQNHYDLILLDQHMPDMDGRETLDHLKEIFKEQEKEVPVVCETADDSEEVKKQLLDAGFSEVLIKPIDFGELHDMMVRRLGDSYSPAEPSREATEEEIDKAVDELPGWVSKVQGLDVRAGLKRCGGSASDYMDALAIFSASIDEKTKTEQHYLDTADERIRILRLHSLKSQARLVGAMTIAEQAAALEMAGKVGNDKALASGAKTMIAHYKELEEQLKAHIGNPGSREGLMPPISEETLADTYAALKDACAAGREEDVDALLGTLSEYDLKSRDAVRLERMKIARRRNDWVLLEEAISESESTKD